MNFKEIVEKRYAAKKFNGKEIPEEKVDELLDLIRLSPSSFNIQPWKIKIVKDKSTKEKLLPASFNQPQITTASHVLVFCADKNIKEKVDRLLENMRKTDTPSEVVESYGKMMHGFIDNLSEEQKISWAQRQVYIALANALNGAKSLGFDSCPMEGFNPHEYTKILNLPNKLVATVVVPIGYAADQPREKSRFKKEDIFF